MNKTLIALLVVVCLIVGGVAAYVATQPETYSISRSVTISAPPEAVFPHVNDFQQWKA